MSTGSLRNTVSPHETFEVEFEITYSIGPQAIPGNPHQCRMMNKIEKLHRSDYGPIPNGRYVLEDRSQNGHAPVHVHKRGEKWTLDYWPVVSD